jgi:ribosomal protein S18 acetylase RimI-like enzyme
MTIRAASPSDLDAIFGLFASRDRAAFGQVEVLRRHIAEGFDLGSTDHFVAVDGGVVGYGTLSGSRQVVVVAGDDPSAAELLAAIEGRARERAFEQITALPAHEDARFDALVRHAGFGQHGDVLRMWRPLTEPFDEPAWPDGVAVRTYEPSDAAVVKALLDDAYTWDDTHTPLPLDDWVQWMTSDAEFDAALWFLAERDGELVACALHWDSIDRRGWVKDLAVRAGERGRGLGAALLRHGFGAYAARGASGVGLKVHSMNPTGAVRLYDREGFVVDRGYGSWAKSL